MAQFPGFQLQQLRNKGTYTPTGGQNQSTDTLQLAKPRLGAPLRHHPPKAWSIKVGRSTKFLVKPCKPNQGSTECDSVEHLHMPSTPIHIAGVYNVHLPQHSTEAAAAAHDSRCKWLKLVPASKPTSIRQMCQHRVLSVDTSA